MIEIDVKSPIGPILNVTEHPSKPIDPVISNLSEKKAGLGTMQTKNDRLEITDNGSLRIVPVEGMPLDSILLVSEVTVVRLQRQSGTPSSIDITLRVSAVGAKNLR